MQIINVGSFYCKFCRKNIPTQVYTDNPDLILKYKDEAISFAKNLHWYDNHYNCALCGRWIPSGERELIVEEAFTSEMHPKYNHDIRTGLLRMHKKCVNKLGK